MASTGHATARPRRAWQQLRGLAYWLRLRFGSNDIARRDAGLHLLQRAADVLLPGYVLTEHSKAWWEDEEFFTRYGRLERSKRSSDRKFFLLQLLKLIEDVPGDTVEAGVFEGASSWLICDRLAGSDRTHFAFDSFEGLPAAGPGDATHWEVGDLEADERKVRELLAGFEAVVEKGWIPEVFAPAHDRRFALVHIDVDLYEPTLDSLEFFYPRTNPGGVIVCDDYGVTTCPGAMRAVDEYMGERPEPVLHAPTGQAVILKSAP